MLKEKWITQLHEELPNIAIAKQEQTTICFSCRLGVLIQCYWDSFGQEDEENGRL